jgi:hypothetical protein
MKCTECFFETGNGGCYYFPLMVVNERSEWNGRCKYKKEKINGKNWSEVEKETSQKQGSRSIAPF